MTDAGGATVGAIKYFPFGLTRSTTGTISTDKKFTGQRLDSTGLYYYGARYYDPQIGRFISADTIVPDPMNPQALNRYSYCLNNPLKYIDPTGHWPNWGSIGKFIKQTTQAIARNIDTIQTALDVAGMIPVVGEAFDCINGVIYAARGDAVNAGLSFASMIPLAGNVIGGAKLVAAAVVFIKVVSKVEKAIDRSYYVGKLVNKAEGFKTFDELKKHIQTDGVLHHIVEQSQIKDTRAGFDPELIHNPRNVIGLSAEDNQRLADYYSSIKWWSEGQTVRDYLSTKKFEEQYNRGLTIMEELGIIQ